MTPFLRSGSRALLVAVLTGGLLWTGPVLAGTGSTGPGGPVADAEERRSEVLHLNEMDGPVFKVTNDPRRTWLGRFIRRYSVDELPQLINVIRGEMSLVGPRPLPLYEASRIKGVQRRRLAMRPGLSGSWQTRGRSTIDFDEPMRDAIANLTVDAVHAF